jgi:hypothetical protein
MGIKGGNDVIFVYNKEKTKGIMHAKKLCNVIWSSGKNTSLGDGSGYFRGSDCGFFDDGDGSQ